MLTIHGKGVGVPVPVGVEVGVLVLVGVGVGVLVFEGVDVGVPVFEGVRVGVAVCDGVDREVLEADGAAGVPEALGAGGSGEAWRKRMGGLLPVLARMFRGELWSQRCPTPELTWLAAGVLELKMMSRLSTSSTLCSIGCNDCCSNLLVMENSTSGD